MRGGFRSKVRKKMIFDLHAFCSKLTPKQTYLSRPKPCAERTASVCLSTSGQVWKTSLLMFGRQTSRETVSSWHATLCGPSCLGYCPSASPCRRGGSRSLPRSRRRRRPPSRAGRSWKEGRLLPKYSEEHRGSRPSSSCIGCVTPGNPTGPCLHPRTNSRWPGGTEGTEARSASAARFLPVVAASWRIVEKAFSRNARAARSLAAAQRHAPRAPTPRKPSRAPRSS